jgi:hypothetical protein
MRILRLFSIVVLVGIVAAILYAGWQRNTPNQFEAAFAPGGTVALDLSAGGYNLIGTKENKIRVEIDRGDTREARCHMSISNTKAKVQVEGPSNNFHVTIYIPERSDLQVDQTIGNMEITGVEGNKNLALGIGRIHLEVQDGTTTPSLEGGVIIGSLRADNWHISKGGFFRSIESNSAGPYYIRAHVDIGDLEVAGAGTHVNAFHSQKSGDADEDMSDEDSGDNSQ